MFRQMPNLVKESVVSNPLPEAGFEQTVSFEAHDIEYLALRFDVDKEANDYSGTEIRVELFQNESSLGSWTIQPDQITNIYYYYIPVNLHHIPAGEITMRINASGEAPVGLFVGNGSADYILVYDSYSRSKLLLIAFAVTICLFAGYILFIRGKNTERRFLYLYLTLGILYFLVCPILTEPDAKNHYCRAYEVSEATWISPVNAEGNAENSFSIPEGWATDSDSIHVSLYETWYQKDFQIDEETQKLYQYNNMALYSPVSYSAQSLGFAVGRIFTNNFLANVMIARLLNFLFAGLLFYLAIALTPVGKQYILWISMLPMGMELAASISSDTVTTALVCLLVAMVCRYRYSERIITVPEMILLYAVALLLSQYKIVYVVFCLLLFLIPQKAFGGKKGYFIHAGILGSLVAAASLLWLHISGNFLEQHFLLSTYQKDFILHNPVKFILAILNTVLVYGADIVRTMVGSNLGALSFTTNAAIVLFLLAFLFARILKDRYKAQSGEQQDHVTSWWMGGIIVLSVLLILTSEYLQWNDVGETAIGGLQGRYFIPLLYPVLLLAGKRLTNGHITETVKKDTTEQVLLAFNLCFVMQLFLHFVF
ncbi:MAG: DUF2142 domain-containing protein [Lachnospiraceae bacterium]|nr:DUF2142 domain-containing protein [Lachnospiraceae bacterium]